MKITTNYKNYISLLGADKTVTRANVISFAAQNTDKKSIVNNTLNPLEKDVFTPSFLADQTIVSEYDSFAKTAPVDFKSVYSMKPLTPVKQNMSFAKKLISKIKKFFA